MDPSPRNKLLARVWAPTRELWGRSTGDFIVHAHILAEYGRNSLTSLSIKQLEAVADWAGAVTNDDFRDT